jgi:hypothetical protein
MSFSDIDRIAEALSETLRQFELLLHKPRLRSEYLMALDFTKLSAAVALAQSNATALEAQAAASSDASNQAQIDSLANSLDTANATTTALLPTPEPETAPVVEEPTA